MLGFQTFTTSGKKRLNYKNVLTFLIHLIFSTSLCHFCLDVQSSWSEAPAVTQVAACLMDDGNRGGGVPAMIRALSWQGLPFQAWAQSHSVDRDGCVGGWVEGWMGEEETDMRLSYGTRHNLSFCVISSPPDPCTFLPFPSIQPQTQSASVRVDLAVFCRVLLMLEL